MTWCARIRFTLPARVSINCDDRELPIGGAPGDVRLVAAESGKGLADTRNVALVAKGFRSEADAHAAGLHWRGVLQKAFAGMNLPADFGDRAATGAFTAHGLAMLIEQHGQRILNDVHGLMVFECDPWPRFARAGANAVVGRPAEQIIDAIEAAEHLDIVADDRERLAYDLYSASFSEPSADARFVMLMMAVETLLDPEPRAPEVRAHVDRLIAETRAAGLDKGANDSLVGSLTWLYNESISQAGRRVAGQLGDREYMGEKPAKFFTRCYSLRSQLVHGSYPRPSRGEVDGRAAALELFVANLLSVELLNELSV